MRLENTPFLFIYSHYILLIILSDFSSDSETPISVLSEASTLIKTELKHIDKHFYKKFIAIILLIAFILLPVFLPAKEGSWFHISEPLGRIVYTLRIVLTVFLCGFAWLFLITRSQEKHVYEGVLREINLELQHDHTSYRLK